VNFTGPGAIAPACGPLDEWPRQGPPFAGGPPRRSQRAELPHRAPTLGAWRRSAPPGRDASRGRAVATGLRPGHPFPVDPGFLAAAPQRPPPVPGYLVAEGRHCPDAARHGVVRHMPVHHAGQPAALLRNRQPRPHHPGHPSRTSAHSVDRPGHPGGRAASQGRRRLRARHRSRAAPSASICVIITCIMGCRHIHNQARDAAFVVEVKRCIESTISVIRDLTFAGSAVLDRPAQRGRGLRPLPHRHLGAGLCAWSSIRSASRGPAGSRRSRFCSVSWAGGFQLVRSFCLDHG
jgi:hypothetical protein